MSKTKYVGILYTHNTQRVELLIFIRPALCRAPLGLLQTSRGSSSAVQVEQYRLEPPSIRIIVDASMFESCSHVATAGAFLQDSIGP